MPGLIILLLCREYVPHEEGLIVFVGLVLRIDVVICLAFRRSVSLAESAPDLLILWLTFRSAVGFVFLSLSL